MIKKRLFYILSICLLLVGIITFVNPIGNFPLNDDWQYAYPVKSLVEKSSYDLINYFSPNIFLQVIWGYLFCLIPNEFSFTYLRISTLVSALFCGIIFFQIIKSQTEKGSKEMLLLSIFFVFNPLFFSLAFSFMTDVPFLTLCLGSIFFYKSYLDKKKIYFRILGACFAVAALFIRQPGILILIGAESSIVLFYYYQQKKMANSTSSILKSHQFFSFIFSIFISVVVYLFIENFLKNWLEVSDHYISVGDEYIDTVIENPMLFVFQFSKRALMTVFYMGLFCFPMIALIIEWIYKNRFNQKWLFTLIVGINLLITFVLFQFDYIFPYGGNIFYNLGLGPVLLKDIYYLKMTVGFEVSNLVVISFGLFCQVLGCYIFILLGRKLLQSYKKPLENQFFLLLVFVNIFYLGAMMIFSYFDRYLLLLFASILIIFFNEKSKLKLYQYRSFLILAFLTGWFSIMATKDYMTWNRVTQSTYNELISEGIEKNNIDAGWPINGFEGTLEGGEYEREYILSFNKIENYKQLKTITFYRWLFLGNDKILVLKKQN